MKTGFQIILQCTGTFDSRVELMPFPSAGYGKIAVGWVKVYMRNKESTVLIQLARVQKICVNCQGEKRRNTTALRVIVLKIKSFVNSSEWITEFYRVINFNFGLYSSLK